MMNVTVCPTFYPMNFITKERDVLDDPLPLDVLEERLRELVAYREIKHIDVMGGEISNLPYDYFVMLMKTLHKFHDGKPNIYSDLDQLASFLKAPNPPFTLSVIMNEDEKVHHTMTNLLQIPYEVEMVVLIRKHHTLADDNQIVTTVDSLNRVQNVWSVLFQPYSTSPYLKESLTYKEFEDFLKRFIRSDTFGKVMMNRKMIEQAIRGERKSYASNHVYITPQGKYAVVSYSEPEALTTFNTFEQYLDYCEDELRVVAGNPFCGHCPYVGHCLTEGYQRVQSLDHSCNGYRLLLDWYKENYGGLIFTH